MNLKKDIQSKENDLGFSEIEKFSRLDKILMVLLRFIENLKNSLNKEWINLGKKITIEKLFEERLWVIYVQKDTFSSKQY